MNSRPFLSVVIPTRDRPQLLRYPLWSLVQQTERDFEVIVCDNPTTLPAKATFDEFADERFRYVRPEKPLGMVENWNFAISHARGTYVTVLEDKFALRLDCVQWMKELLGRMPAEALHWYHDMFYPDAEPEKPAAGHYYEYHPKVLPPTYFEPRAVLEKRLSWEFVRGQEGGMYGAVKILLGAYHADLVARIIKRTGRMFHPTTPDYTSLAAACLLAKSAIDGGRAGCVGIISPLSNGYQATQKSERMVEYLNSVGDLNKILADCPLPGLIMSASNLVCHDLLAMCRILPEEARGLELNYVKLHARCTDELVPVTWRDDAEKEEQFRILRESVQHFPRRQRLAFRLDRQARACRSRLCSRVLERASEKLQPASSISANSPLWERWTKSTLYKRMPFALRLEEFLLCHQVTELSDEALNSLSMSAEEISLLRPDDRTAPLERLAKTLISENERLRSEMALIAEANSQKLADFRAKVANLAEMIERRDARITKLERKLGIQPKKAQAGD